MSKRFQSIRHQKRQQKKERMIKQKQETVNKNEQEMNLPYTLKGLDYWMDFWKLPKKGYVKTVIISLDFAITEKEFRERAFKGYGDLKSSEE